MSINKTHEDILGLSSSSYPTGSSEDIKELLEPSEGKNSETASQDVLQYYRKKIDELIEEVNNIKDALTGG